MLACPSRPLPIPPVVDLDMLHEVQLMLAPAPLELYLRALLGRGEALLLRLRHGAAGGLDDDMAEAAHAFSGSVDMFGFRHAATIGRRFEYAVRDRVASASLAVEFVAAIKLALEMMRRLIGLRAFSDR